MKTDNFYIIKCIESGRGFIEGEYYAVVGWNNGAHVMSVNSEGEPREFLLHNYVDCVIDDDGRQISGESWLAPANGEETPKFEHADFAPVIHGHWVKVENARNVFKCSRCGHTRELRHIFEIMSKPKLCEECGAKMDEEEENVRTEKRT